jgi:dinuclear metal center YbgI/SA1388 family protein
LAVTLFAVLNLSDLMPKIGDIIRYIEGIAPPSLQESYDNAGLIVGYPDAECSGVIICLDTIEEVVDEAIEKKCNLVLAHHPIVFGGLKRFNGRSYVERVVMKAIKHDIAIYAAHTNLDNVLYQGVNAKIAERLNLTNTRILAPKRGLLKKLYTFAPKAHAEAVRQALFEAGAGQIGNYSECSFNLEGEGTFKAGDNTNPHVGEQGSRHHEAETKFEVIVADYTLGKVLAALQKAHPYEEVAYDVVSLDNKHPQIGAGLVGELQEAMPSKDFLQFLKTQMQTDCVRYTNIHTDKIKRVALCGGAGSFLLNQAISAKADVFITGDYKYHQFFDAENRIIIADIGHFESEQFTIDLFYELITQKFPNFTALRTTICTNPVNYL